VESGGADARLEGDIRGFPDGYQTLVEANGGSTLHRRASGIPGPPLGSRRLMVTAPLLVLPNDALATVDTTTCRRAFAELGSG